MNEIRIIAPGVDCKISKVNIATKIACDIIDEIFHKSSLDVMSIHEADGDCVAEITVKDDLLSIRQHGRRRCYILLDAEVVISNIIINLM